jgi:hypothetical protein
MYLPRPKNSSKRHILVTRPPATSLKLEKDIAGISVFVFFHVKIARVSGIVNFFAVQMFHVILIDVGAGIWNCY